MDSISIRRIRDAAESILRELDMATVPEPPLRVEIPIVYGLEGYSDQSDPRQSTARFHHHNPNDKVDAVELRVHTKPRTRYSCVNVSVVSEEESGGRIIAYVYVYDKSGQPATPPVILGTGYQGSVDFFDDFLLPGNARIPIEHVIASGFNPPDLGPLAIFVAAADKRTLDSDVVASLGLPFGRHISFLIEFKERE